MTDLELIVLGVIWRFGPCTPYSIREVFRKSLSAHWNCSTGSIYPIIRRLEKNRLVTGKKEPRGRRPAVMYEVSKTGLTFLKEWLSPPAPGGEQLLTLDPLRSRIRFLEVLKKKDQLAFLDSAEESLKDHVKKAEQDSRERKKQADRFAYMVSRGAIRSMKSQIAWLKEVRESICKK